MFDDIHDENLKKRLERFQEAPDDNIWDKIEASITHADEITVSDKLKSYQAQPDDSIWPSIQHALYLNKLLTKIHLTQIVVSLVSLLLLLYSLYFISIRKSDTNQFQAQNSSGEKADTLKPTPSAQTLKDSNSFVIDSGPSIQAKQQTTMSNNGDEKINNNTIGVNKNNRNSGYLKNNIATRNGTSFNDSSSENNASSSIKSDVESADEQNTVKTRNEYKQGVEGADVKTLPEQSVGIAVSSLYLTETLDGDEDTEGNSQTNVVEKIIDSNTMQNRASVQRCESVEDKLHADSVLKVSDTSAVVVSTKKNPVSDVKNIVVKREDKEKAKRRLSVYALLMPTLGYQQIKPIKDDGVLIEGIERLSAFSPKRLGIRAELGIEKKLTERIGLTLSLVYYQRKQQIAYYYRSTEQVEVIPIDTESLVYGVNMSEQTAVFNYEVKNIGTALGINYTIKKDKLIQMLGVMGELHYDLSKSDDDFKKGNPLYLFGDIYYRVSYPINPRFDMMLQPTLNYSLSLHDMVNTPFYIKPYGLGLNVGIYYHF